MATIAHIETRAARRPPVSGGDAGHVVMPEHGGRRRRHPAVVLSMPAGPFHAPVGALYARKLAARGFAVIVVEAARAGDGDAGDGNGRARAIHRAVDHLVTLPFVDATRIALLGICSGGGDAVEAAQSEHRIRALGTVAGTDAGGAFPLAALPAHAGARLVQPLMVIVGGRHGGTRQLACGRALYGRARGPDKALVVIPGADDHDLQHRDACVDPAIDRLAPFFAFHLAP